MKKSCLSAMFLLIAGIISAQESYTIKMSVRMEGLPPEYAAYGEQEIVSWIKGKKSKTEISSMMYNSTVYFDGEKITTLSDMMGNKQGYTATREELEKMEKADTLKKTDINYTSEKKMVAGYECTKAVIKSEGKDGAPKEIIAWVTDKIKAERTPGRSSQGMKELSDLKGHPLEMEMSQEAQGSDVKVVMTTTEVLTDDIPDNMFVANTEGYKMYTFEEWREQMKKMQGK